MSVLRIADREIRSSRIPGQGRPFPKEVRCSFGVADEGSSLGGDRQTYVAVLHRYFATRLRLSVFSVGHFRRNIEVHLGFDLPAVKCQQDAVVKMRSDDRINIAIGL